MATLARRSLHSCRRLLASAQSTPPHHPSRDSQPATVATATLERPEDVFPSLAQDPPSHSQSHSQSQSHSDQTTSSTSQATQTTRSTITTISPLSDVDLVTRRNKYNNYLTQFGSTVAPHYSHRDLLFHPPDVKQVGIEALLAAEAHMGHSPSLWNPITQPYLYGIRGGIHIIDLDVTLSHLARAAEVVQGVALNDGNILFVGTRPGQKRAVVEAAKKAHAYHVFDRWVPGTITNGAQVVGHGRVRQMGVKHKNNVRQLRTGDALPQAVTPDLVIVLNPLENRNLIRECAKARVPTIGIIDTDADPRWVTYAIPANDDSLRTATLIAGVLARAAEQGRKLLLSGEGGAEGDWVQEEVLPQTQEQDRSSA
ncbi:hypothetical protein PYCC9005_003493 [Savitreella phatthalungensis]